MKPFVWPFLGVLAIIYLLIVEALDWFGRMEVIENRWPKVWSLISNRPSRLVLLLVACTLLAKDVSERWRDEGSPALQVIMPSIPAPVINLVSESSKPISERQTATQTAGPPPAKPVAVPPSITQTSQEVPTTDGNHVYQVTLQSNTSITPVGLLLTFNGSIETVNFHLSGNPVMMMSQGFVDDRDPRTVVVRFAFPALSPESPLIVTVESKETVSLISVQRISAAMNGSIIPE
jgi:hypothetical protein